MIRSRQKTAAVVTMTIAAALVGLAFVDGCDQGTPASPTFNDDRTDATTATNALCPTVEPNFDSIANDLLGSNTCGATRGGKCHSATGAPNSGMLDFTVSNEAIYTELLGDGGTLAKGFNIAGDDKTLSRVVPGDAGASFLYIKLVTNTGADPHYGSGMPQDFPGQLCPAAIQAVKTWIDEGAPFAASDAGADSGDDSGITDASADTGTDAGDH